MQSIFLHGGWRCSSTYLWNKFRQRAAVTAFYEPFSEQLARYSAADIAKDVTSAWESRHPQLDAPYAAEYLPLIAGAGVPSYRDSFAVQRYFVARDEPLHEREYLASLLAHARNWTDYCVLGFSRSLGRTGAIKQNFPGYHVVLMRDPLQQWLSCRSYRVKFEQPYFELCHALILALAPRDSLAGQAARWLKLPAPPAGSFKQQFKFMRSSLRRLDDELSYRVFLAVYILSYLEALPEADLLIDMDSLGESSANKAAARAIATRTGLALDFSDWSLPIHDTADVALDFKRIHDGVLGWLLAQEVRLASRPKSALQTSAWCLVSEKLQNALLLAPRNPPRRPIPPVAKDAVGFGARLRGLLKFSSL